jgi:DNA polymerase-3 subunit gamma/tau
MRDALTTLDRVIAAGDGAISEDLVRELLGIVPAFRVQGVLEALAAGDAAGILDHTQALAEQGADWDTFWRELVTSLRGRLEQEARAGGGPQALLRWARVTQLLLQRERDLRDSALKRAVVELALVTASQLPQLAPLEALLTAAAAPGAPRPAAPVPARPSPPPNPNPAPQAVSAPVAVAPPAGEEIRALAPGTGGEALRSAVAAALKVSTSLPKSLATLPHMASAVLWEARTLTFRFPASAKPTAEPLLRERESPHLLGTLAPLLPGLAYVDVCFDEPIQTEPPEARIRKDPAFQELLRLSGGEVVEVRKAD